MQTHIECTLCDIDSNQNKTCLYYINCKNCGKKMSAVIKSDIDKKRNKSKSVLGYCNGLLARIIPSNSKSMLKVDAVPIKNHSQQMENALSEVTGSENENSPEYSVVPKNANAQIVPTPPMQMIQNNLNQANQNLTVIESQQNLHFNNIHGLQIGNTFHVSGSSSRKNSCNGSYDHKTGAACAPGEVTNHKKTRSTVGKYLNQMQIKYCVRA